MCQLVLECVGHNVYTGSKYADHALQLQFIDQWNVWIKPPDRLVQRPPSKLARTFSIERRQLSREGFKVACKARQPLGPVVESVLDDDRMCVLRELAQPIEQVSVQ